MAQNEPDPNAPDLSGQVLRFRKRGVGPWPIHAAASQRGEETGDDFAEYEDEDREIDYRHRMLMNVIAVVVVALLVGAGVWIADTIADMERDQDCVMQGRNNCAPIEVPPINRK